MWTNLYTSIKPLNFTYAELTMSSNPSKSKLPTVEELLGILALSIDSHKLHLAEYTFLTDEKHKEIKSAITQEKSDDVREKIQDLEEYLYLALGEVFDEQVSYLKDIFHCRSNLPIGACIKIIIDRSVIVTLYSNPESFQYDPFAYSQNTAFKEILECNLDYYLCNNIPQSSKEGTYLNNRIDINKLKNANDIEQKDVDGKYDRLWASFWQGDSIDSTYKSTLVVPMSLVTDELDIQFREHLSLATESSKRLILGFFCLDHPHNNFFDLKTDIKIAFLFANMFSLYLIHQFNITQYSNKYKEAVEIIDEIKKNYDNTQWSEPRTINYEDANPKRKPKKRELGNASQERQDSLAKARARGHKYREKSIQDSFSSEDVMNLLKISADELDKLQRSSQIIALNNGDNYVYPKCQFSENKIIDGIAKIIKELPIEEGWTQLIFLESVAPELQGDTPIDRLRKGDISSALLAAGNYGRQRPV